MLDTLISVVETYRQPTSRIVLALSGGVDSRVLLDLLACYKAKNKNVTCFAVHVHHGLSEHADDWAIQCQRWCAEYDIELFVERVQLKLANQISTEQEARDKRYQALEKHVRQDDLLLTGQHSSDQMETFLLALKRGSGPKGLSAMPECAPFANGFLVRPLLNVNQAAIVDYAELKRLKWVEDDSNQDTQFDRNFLRKEVIPALQQRWPSIEKSVLRSSKLCADQESLINELLQERLENFTDGDGGMSILDLASQSELARNQLMRLWLAAQHCSMPSQAQLNLIWNEVAQARQDANPRIKITSGEVRRFKNTLYFIGKISDVTSWQSAVGLGQTVCLPDGLGTLSYINKQTNTPLSLRAPIEKEQVNVHFNPRGLTAHPVERVHSRKLKKLFQEYAVPNWLRTRTPIIMYGNEIAMVVDLFVCKDFHGDDCEMVWDKV